MLSLVLPALVGGVVVGTVWALVLADSAGLFPLPDGWASYWLSLPKLVVRATVVLQLVTLACYVAWVACATPTLVVVVLHTVLLVTQAVWPLVAYRLVVRPSLARAVAACVPLWLAAGAAVGMLVVDRSALLVPLVLLTVVADGGVWAAAAIVHGKA